MVFSANEMPTKLEKQLFAKLFLPSVVDPSIPSSRESALWWESYGKVSGKELPRQALLKPTSAAKIPKFPHFFAKTHKYENTISDVWGSSS